ncbi:hypothetical protein KC19_3G021600 [Ceratodon purpureus]|uniref:Uncharacterized protein n=1 Tax=Ceratodon purpureus TaxID=3225 RepID=A0A8T0IGA7_CERPU|nr:hypothetical protein KC19_3G021600 [Ceratodon purpureus]
MSVLDFYPTVPVPIPIRIQIRVRMQWGSFRRIWRAREMGSVTATLYRSGSLPRHRWSRSSRVAPRVSVVIKVG